MNKQSALLFTSGLLQGISLIAFPAVSTILTNPSEFALSNAAYGSLFIPESLLSIAASAINPMLIRNFGSKLVFLIGLAANMAAMALLASSALLMHHSIPAYIVLLSATGCLGLGFGLTVPTINEMAALLHPSAIDRALLVLNALLGIGTALAPIFTIVFAAAGFWWGLPALLSALLLALLLFSLPLNLPGDKSENETASHSEKTPGRFWIFAAAALLYGIVETLNSNWVSIYASESLQAPIRTQSLALSAFWGMLTFGRIFYALLGKIVSEEFIFAISPFVLSVGFLLIALLPPGVGYEAVAAFGFAGFGCSALLPLIIGFGSRQLAAIAPSIPGMIISFYLAGYGIAAFGVGPLQDITAVSLRLFYAIGAAIALVLGLLAISIVHERKDS